MEARFIDSCPRKKLTFTDVSTLITSMDSSPAVAGNTAAAVKPSTPANYDSDDAELGEAMVNFNKIRGENEERFGFAEEMVSNFSTRPPITENTILK